MRECKDFWGKKLQRNFEKQIKFGNSHHQHCIFVFVSWGIQYDLEFKLKKYDNACIIYQTQSISLNDASGHAKLGISSSGCWSQNHRMLGANKRANTGAVDVDLVPLVGRQGFPRCSEYQEHRLLRNLQPFFLNFFFPKCYYRVF